jgi:Mg2+ and Co2+ transporter CorA
MSNNVTPFSASSSSRRAAVTNNRIGVETMRDEEDEEGSSKNSAENLSQVSPLPSNSSVGDEKRKSSFLTQINKTLTNAGLVQPVPAAEFTTKKRRNRPFLTSSQLIDLFNRLDHNGDGSLDLEEFTDIVQMLKLQVTKEYIEKIFRNFKKDSLTMQEFICAYQKIYSNQTMDNVASNKQEEEFIRATRYGVDEDGDRIFEVYLIDKSKTHSSGSSRMKGNRRIRFQLNQAREGIVSLEDHFKSAVEELWEGDIEEINSMVRKDSVSNGDEGGRILWWIDISMAVVERSSIHKYVDAFGIPNNSKFLSNFANFGSALGKDPKSRFFVGNGVTVDGLTSSMNMFIQTAVLKDRPIGHLFPAWIENRFNSIKSKLFQYIKEYYVSRFAFIFNLSSWSNSNRQETLTSYETAERIAHRLRDDVFDYSDIDSDEEHEEEKTRKQQSTEKSIPLQPSEANSGSSSPRWKTQFTKNLYSIVSSMGQGVPLSSHGARYTAAPTWIRSNAQLMKNKPSLKLDTLSMHLMNHGSGPNALITIRAMEDEKHSFRLSLEGKSRCGVLGRLLDAIWVKLLVINGADGAADIAGELDESPMTLMSFITTMVHCFSTKSMTSLDYWLNTVEREINDMAVSKHSSHLAEMSRIVKEFNDYVDPLLTTLTDFLDSWEKETEQVMRAVADAVGEGPRNDEVIPLNKPDKENRLTRMRGSILPTGPKASMVGNIGPKTTMVGNIGLKLEQGNAANAGRRRGSARRASNLMMLTAMHKTPSVAIVNSANSMMELEKLPLSYHLVKDFMGDASYRDLKIMLEGYELLDMKGLIFWCERIEKYEQRLSDMRSLIATQLDEKRNFTTFLLTIVTTVLAPLTILTGYFGMNFTNMSELDPDTYPYAPGVWIMWAIAGLLYIIMFLFSMHFRVIYSAT